MIVHVLTWVGVDVDEGRVRHTITEAAKSIAVVTPTIVLGLGTDSWLNGGPGFLGSDHVWHVEQARNLADVLAYAHAHWLPWFMVNVLLPAKKSYDAARTPLDGRRSSDGTSTSSVVPSKQSSSS
jgi:hypothetical protein